MSREKVFTGQQRCKHCGNTAPHEVVATYSQVREEQDERLGLTWDEGRVYLLSVCPACDGVTLTRYYEHPMAESGALDREDLYPQSTNAPQGLPRSIALAHEAAERVKAIEPNAYAVLLRRLLELVCQDRDAVGDTLNLQLQSLASRGEIPTQLVKVAASLRQLGNVGAHATLGTLQGSETPILDALARAILEYVYGAPYLVQRAEQSLQRLQKKTHKRK